MSKILNKPWFVATLALAAALVAGKRFLFQGNGEATPAAADKAAAIEKTPVPANDVMQAPAIPVAVRDPFAARKRTEGPGAVNTVLLSAIWTQEGRTMVLINGRILQAGDDIGPFRVESATQEGVWIRHWKGCDFIPLGGIFTLITPAKPGAAPMSPPQL